MVTLAGDGRVHVPVNAFTSDPDPDHDCHPRSALGAQRALRSTFADRHLFIQSFNLQGSPGLNLAWRYISRANPRFPHT